MFNSHPCFFTSGRSAYADPQFVSRSYLDTPYLGAWVRSAKANLRRSVDHMLLGSFRREYCEGL